MFKKLLAPSQRAHPTLEERRRALRDTGFGQLQAMVEPGEDLLMMVQTVLSSQRHGRPAFVGLTGRRFLLYLAPFQPWRPEVVPESRHAFDRAAVRAKQPRAWAPDFPSLRLKTPVGILRFQAGPGIPELRAELERLPSGLA